MKTRAKSTLVTAVVLLVSACGGEADTAEEIASDQLAVYTPDPIGGGGSTACGDGVCSISAMETCFSCPKDCGLCSGEEPLKCGDYKCLAGETCKSCPFDCGSCCGNKVCDYGETQSTCPQDCGYPSTWAQIQPWGTGSIYQAWNRGKPAGAFWVTAYPGRNLPYAAAYGARPNEVWVEASFTITDGTVQKTMTTAKLVYVHNKYIKRIVSDSFSRVSWPIDGIVYDCLILWTAAGDLLNIVSLDPDSEENPGHFSASANFQKMWIETDI